MRTLFLFGLAVSLAACGGNEAPPPAAPIINEAPAQPEVTPPAVVEAPAVTEPVGAPQPITPTLPPPLPPAAGIEFNSGVGQAAFSNYLATLGHRDATLAGRGMTEVTATIASWNNFTLSQCLPPPPPQNETGVWCTATGLISVDYRLGNELRNAQPMEVTGRMFFSKKPDGWRLEAWNPSPAN